MQDHQALQVRKAILAHRGAFPVVRSNCDETNCAVQCGEDEMLLTAYCGT